LVLLYVSYIQDRILPLNQFKRLNWSTIWLR